MLLPSCGWSSAAGVDDSVLGFDDFMACNASAAMCRDRESIAASFACSDDYEASDLRAGLLFGADEDWVGVETVRGGVPVGRRGPGRQEHSTELEEFERLRSVDRRW